MKPITSVCAILPIQRIEFERRVSRVTWILRFQHFVMCVCVFAFLVGSDPDIVFKMIISGDGDQTGKEDMTVIQEMITTLQVNCSINQGHFTSNFYDFFLSLWKLEAMGWRGGHAWPSWSGWPGIIQHKTKLYLSFFFTKTLQKWNYWWTKWAFPNGAQSIARKSRGLRGKVDIRV